MGEKKDFGFGKIFAQLDEMNARLDRIQNNVPSAAFIVFWVGAFHLIAGLGGWMLISFMRS